MPAEAAEQMRCPTCGARQVWSDTCRRCKCDLRLLRAATAAYEEERQRCLEQLHRGAADLALRHARRCHGLRPGVESQRLLAICNLLYGNWPEAWSEAVAIPDDDEEDLA